MAKPADKRADIWAFGVVFYELLTGERLFPGETVAETLAAVVRDTPDFSKLPAAHAPACPATASPVFAQRPEDAPARYRGGAGDVAGRAAPSVDDEKPAPPAAHHPGALAGCRKSWPSAPWSSHGWVGEPALAGKAKRIQFSVAPPARTQNFAVSPVPAVSPDGRRISPS